MKEEILQESNFTVLCLIPGAGGKQPSAFWVGWLLLPCSVAGKVFVWGKIPEYQEMEMLTEVVIAMSSLQAGSQLGVGYLSD